MNEIHIGGTVMGAYGDMEDCEGFLELGPKGELAIYPPEGGTFIKLAGCSYLFKGLPRNETVEGMSAAKAGLFFVPREIVMRDWVLIGALIARYLLSRRKFYFYLHLYVTMIYNRTVAKDTTLPSQYNQFAKEIKRAWYKALWQEYGVGDAMANFSTRDVLKDARISKAAILSKFIEFLCFFLEYDSAYRFRAQDVLENLNKKLLAKDPKRAVLKLLDILIEREHPKIGMSYKWRSLKKITRVALWNPSLRRVIISFLNELDIEKVKLDESDWYFCLRRSQYAFRGWSLEKRLAEKQRIDDIKGHYRFRMQKNLATSETKVVSCYDENFARRVVDFRKELDPLMKKYDIAASAVANLTDGRITALSTVVDLSTLPKVEKGV